MAALDGQMIRKRMLNARSSAVRLRQSLGSTVSTETGLRLLLAVALAFGLWVHVTMRNNPETSQVLRGRTLGVRGLAPGLVVMTALPQVDVNVTGPLILIESSTRPVVPYVDLGGRSAGKGQRVKIESDVPNGLRAVWISPDEVVVDLETIVKKEFALTTEMPATVPFDVRVDQPTIEPGAVVVSGPQSTVAEITRVVVRPDVNVTNPSDLAQTVRPVPLDRLGREVIGPWLEMSPASARVTLPARRVTGQKSISIRPIIVGQPASGYRLDSIAAVPSIVMVRGEAALLQAATALETEPIDISGRQQTLVQTVQLKVPNAVSADRTEVQVEIGIAPIEAKTKVALVAIARGLGPGLRAQIVPGNVDVTLQGPVPRIQALDVGALRAEVSLQGLGPGTHQVRPQIQGPGLDGLRAVESQPEFVTVQIAAEPTPTPTPVPTATPTAAPTRSS